tara:strand:- start:287 stop:493 length:207 start_codon:yes stop_codon:yes gene_type:complete
MSNFTKRIDGLEQFIWLVKRFDMSSIDALKTMKKHNQDISFINGMTLKGASVFLDKMIIELNSIKTEE